MKYLHGLKIVAYNDPMLNYVNFEEEIRAGCLTDLVRMAIFSLSSREILNWIDVVSIFDEHLDGKNFSHSLLRLINLELYLSSR